MVSEAIVGYSDVNDNKNGSVNYDDGNYKKGEVWVLWLWQQ